MKQPQYVTVTAPRTVPLKALRDFADQRGLLVRYGSGGKLLMIDPEMPSNVRRLPARPVAGGAQ